MRVAMALNFRAQGPYIYHCFLNVGNTAEMSWSSQVEMAFGNIFTITSVDGRATCRDYHIPSPL